MHHIYSYLMFQLKSMKRGLVTLAPAPHPRLGFVDSGSVGLTFVRLSFQAVARGVAFEVSYSSALRDATLRRYTIANAAALVDSCKGKVRTRTLTSDITGGGA